MWYSLIFLHVRHVIGITPYGLYNVHKIIKEPFARMVPYGFLVLIFKKSFTTPPRGRTSNPLGDRPLPVAVKNLLVGESDCHNFSGAGLAESVAGFAQGGAGGGYIIE